MQCTACGVELAEGVAVCTNCGAKFKGEALLQDPADLASRSDADLCRRCGVVTLPDATSCAVCAFPIARPPLKYASDTPGLHWVHVVANHICSGCSGVVPANPFVDGQQVKCIHCATLFTVVKDLWDESLVEAHGCADLWRSSLPGNSFINTGISKPSVEVNQGGFVYSGKGMRSRSLTLKITPGRPVCSSCHVPMRVQIGRGLATVHCETCGDEQNYQTPKAFLKRNKGMCAAIPAQAHGKLADLLVCDASGLRCLSCPACAAKLPIPNGVSDLVCQYCNGPFRVPVHFLNPENSLVNAEGIWIAFRGPSVERRKLEKRAESMREPKPPREPEPESEPGAVAPPPSRVGRRALIVGLKILVLAGLWHIDPGGYVSRYVQSPSVASKAAESQPAPQQEDAFAPIEGCACNLVTHDKRTVTTILSRRFAKYGDRAGSYVYQFEMGSDTWKVLRSDIDGFFPAVPVPEGSVMGLACHGSFATFVAASRAASFEPHTQLVRWDEPVRAQRALGVPVAEKFRCVHLKVRDGAAILPGKAGRVKLSSGKFLRR
jgi:hypothetical protein